MPQIPKRTKAEQETLFRFDCEERVLWASTTTPWVARRWSRARMPVTVLSRYEDGTPASWEAKLKWTGQKKPWLRLLSSALFKAGRRERPNVPEAVKGKGSGRVPRRDSLREAPGAI
jgi:hypothetical protein